MSDLEWNEIAAIDEFGDIKDGESVSIELENDNGQIKSIVIVKGHDRWYALDNLCSHDDGPLEDGDISLSNHAIKCARHGAEFNLESGEVISMPAVSPIGSYDVKVEDGILYIKL